MRPLVRDAIIALGVAAGYFACAMIGTLLRVPPSGFAIIWPVTAFLVSVMLILPERRAWLCVVGIVPTHFLLAAILQPDLPLIVVSTQVAGNLALAAATVTAVRWTIAPCPRFDSVKTVFTFILIAGIAVPAVVDALILSVHLATGWIQNLWLSWWQWMIAGIFPTVTIPPLLILARDGELAGDGSRHAPLELALLATLLFVLSFLALGGTVDTRDWPAAFLAPFPFLLWAAVRLGVGGTSVSLLALAGAIVAQALRHHGPFAAQSPIEEVISLQTFLITVSIPLLLLAALMDDRRRAAGLLSQSEARLQIAASSTDTGLWQWDVGAKRLWLTQNCRTMFGLAGTALTPHAFLDAIRPDDRARVAAAIDAALGQGGARPTVEFRLGSGEATRWILLHIRADLDEAGKPLRVSGVFRDISERVEAQLEADELRRRLVHLQDDERRRIAEELHDSTAQHLVAASLNLLNLKAGVSARTRGLVDEILQSIREATTEIRTFAYLLQPAELDSDGLCAVLGQYVPGFARRTGVAATIRTNPLADRLPAEQQHALLRIAQESLGNVHRHARARNVSVSVRCIGGNVHLVVRDDGEGIRPETGQQLGERLRFGIGLPAMTARVRQLGGRIDFSSRSRGTTVHVAVPWSPQEEMAEAQLAAQGSC